MFKLLENRSNSKFAQTQKLFKLKICSNSKNVQILKLFKFCKMF